MSAIVPSVLPNSAEGIDNLNDLSKEWFRMLKVDALRSYLSAHGVPCSSQGKQYVKHKISSTFIRNLETEARNSKP